MSLPLKTAMTGLELLLARAHLWDDTAAKHVSLTQQLRPLEGLAGRWRRLELASWQGLLRRVAIRHAQGMTVMLAPTLEGQEFQMSCFGLPSVMPEAWLSRWLLPLKVKHRLAPSCYLSCPRYGCHAGCHTGRSRSLEGLLAPILQGLEF